MNKKLFNIHKLIGVNILLFFFISLFFGLLTIFQPYVKLWEDKSEHIYDIKVENINLDKCIKQVSKRTYFGEDGKKVRNDTIILSFPQNEVSATNLLRVRNRPNFYIDPISCKRVRPNNFSISKFFDKIHTGSIFNSIIFKIIFGFMSVAVVFLSFTGIFLIFKNNYSNKKTTSSKAFYAKYHRILFLYTLPLIFMFGMTGALFNIGVYSTPLITNYLSEGKTINVLKLQRNILLDPQLKNIDLSKKIKTLNLNSLYKKANEEFEDISFYSMEVYNYNDINARVKFIGYEPKSFFISSITNESYIVLNGTNAEIIDKKVAKQGSFAEKTLDAIFYLHYIRTFSDIPRIIFFLICFCILIGLSFAMVLYLERSKKSRFSYKVLKPLSFTIMLGSLISSSLLFVSAWLIPKAYMFIDFLGKRQSTQELIFYSVFILVFIFILFKKDIYKVTKYSFYLSAFLLISAVIAHDINSAYSIFTLLEAGLTRIFISELFLLFISTIFIYIAKKLPQKYFNF